MTIATATPHGTYEGLRRQFMALRTLAASQETIASSLSKQLRDQTQTLADLEAERATNAQLTEALLAAEAESDRLKAENEALLKDALRYRALREMNWCYGPLAVVANPYGKIKLGSDCPSRERLDSVLDEATAKEASHE